MKGWLQSKTIWGAIAMVLPLILKAFGFEVGESEVNGVVQAVLTIIGFIGVIWGRKTASTSIDGLKLRVKPRSAA